MSWIHKHQTNTFSVRSLIPLLLFYYLQYEIQGTTELIILIINKMKVLQNCLKILYYCIKYFNGSWYNVIHLT